LIKVFQIMYLSISKLTKINYVKFSQFVSANVLDVCVIVIVIL